MPTFKAMNHILTEWKRAFNIEDREKTGNECSICLMSFAKGEEIIELKCSDNHIFHAECLKTWMDAESKTCPLCRSDLKDLARKDTLENKKEE